MKNTQKTVFVGVSGGVDSSVACVLLKEQGYNVVGVFIRTWTPDFIECTWRDERRDAMRVCAHLSIPFLECHAEESYKKGVADYIIEEYKKGRTPNPDVMCNREVKFGTFWDFAKKNGADFIATGHYTMISNSESSNSSRKVTGLNVNTWNISETEADEPSRGRRIFQQKNICDWVYLMKRGVDPSKDQSYFLWTLTQEDLSHTLFPIGHLNKSKVRKLAKKYKIPTATKKDSQGVCFLGPLDMKDFLKHYIESKKGDVLNEDGEVVGYHEGSVFFTLGERKGFTITKKTGNEKPFYVVNKDVSKNTITVSTDPNLSKKGENDVYDLISTNWNLGLPDPKKVYSAQIRYHGEFLNCKIFPTSPTGGKVVFEKNILVAGGQSIVVYDEDICLGGGIVE